MDTVQESTLLNTVETRESLQNAKARLQEAADQARQRGKEALEDSADLVRKYPVQSMAVAALAGAVIGALVIRLAIPTEDGFEEKASRYWQDAREMWSRLKDGIEDNIVRAQKKIR